MRLGIDFDNTLIDYDDAFVAAARERGQIAGDFAGTKRAVRDAIRALPDGELAWQRLQGEVYGRGIVKAVPFAGARAFLKRCVRDGIPTFIVSHKTRHGHFDPTRTDLREAARDWLASQGFLDSDNDGLPPERIFFEDDRAAKLARIAALGCTHFIDDLEEVFADPGFPTGVERILFAAEPSPCCDVHCTSWQQIADALLGDAA